MTLDYNSPLAELTTAFQLVDMAANAAYNVNPDERDQEKVNLLLAKKMSIKDIIDSKIENLEVSPLTTEEAIAQLKKFIDEDLPFREAGWYKSDTGDTLLGVAKAMLISGLKVHQIQTMLELTYSAIQEEYSD